jgi:DNA polymerase-3 subunit alpha
MAFIKLEDRFAEIEVIIFARQYQRFSSEIFEENAVSIEGTLSIEDGDEVRIILTDLAPLRSNTDFSLTKETTGGAKVAVTLYVKVVGMDDKRINSLTRMALLNPGKTKIVVFDVNTKKYSAIKDVFINPSEKVISRLNSIFGDDSVVLK